MLCLKTVVFGQIHTRKRLLHLLFKQRFFKHGITETLAY